MKPVAVSRLLRGLLLAVAVYYALWGGEYSAFDLRRLAAERASRAERLAIVRNEVDSLRTVVRLLDEDLPTLERVARERFGMIRPGEVLYRFVEVEPADTAAERVVAAGDRAP